MRGFQYATSPGLWLASSNLVDSASDPKRAWARRPRSRHAAAVHGPGRRAARGSGIGTV
jgi:hypothetical protein